jgi:hypothetical protein
LGYIADSAGAEGLYEAFHRRPPDRVTRRRLPREIPETLVHLGRVRAIVYSARRGRPPGGERPRTFVHVFDTPPELTCDPEGRQLFLLGGGYRVTRRGIEEEDRERPPRLR